MQILPQLQFDKCRSRIKLCPCGKNNTDLKFVPFVGYDGKGYCHSCGKTFLPGINPQEHLFAKQTNYKRINGLASQRMDFLPIETKNKSLEYWAKNNFAQWLISLFGIKKTEEMCKAFYIGSSNHWKKSTMFWQVDLKGNLRQATIILFTIEDGRRVKKGAFVEKYNHYKKGFEKMIAKYDCVKVYGKFLSNQTQKLNLSQCFFGENQLYQYPLKMVGIVEGQKTAIILSFFYPDYIWLATGGKNGCKWTDLKVCSVLKNRKVVLFPDKGSDCYQAWQSKAAEIKSKVNCSIVVSNILEETELGNKLNNGEDLADYILQHLPMGKPP